MLDTIYISWNECDDPIPVDLILIDGIDVDTIHVVDWGWVVVVFQNETMVEVEQKNKQKKKTKKSRIWWKTGKTFSYLTYLDINNEQIMYN